MSLRIVRDQLRMKLKELTEVADVRLGEGSHGMKYGRETAESKC